MNYKRSDLIIPISIIVHLTIINSLLYYYNPYYPTNPFLILYYNFAWLSIALFLNYYPTKRTEKFTSNLKQVGYLYALFSLAYFSSFVFIGEIPSLKNQIAVLTLIFSIIFLYRILFYYLRKIYRLEGGNYVNVVVIGKDNNLIKIKEVFDNPYLGYRYKGFFDDTKDNTPLYLGEVADCFLFILENHIDEIYCSASRLGKGELQNLISFADNNLIKIKIIPDNKDVITRAMYIQHYASVPVLNLRQVPLDTDFARFTKRTFDIIFSSLVILLLLSWLTPILYFLIKRESRGPVFFRQRRHGLKRKLFWCYKFRTMTQNSESDNPMTCKNDIRVTKIGRFLRKTSLDELPQFYNVFMGDMSVVGPRPHMKYHTENYENSVDKYLVRHFVKPGITGLAQILGYRGEIIKFSDIRNRTKLDIFYVEKWTIWMDLKIILVTIKNCIHGEEKAY